MCVNGLRKVYHRGFNRILLSAIVGPVIYCTDWPNKKAYKILEAMGEPSIFNWYLLGFATTNFYYNYIRNHESLPKVRVKMLVFGCFIVRVYWLGQMNTWSTQSVTTWYLSYMPAQCQAGHLLNQDGNVSCICCRQLRFEVQNLSKV